MSEIDLEERKELNRRIANRIDPNNGAIPDERGLSLDRIIPYDGKYENMLEAELLTHLHELQKELTYVRGETQQDVADEYNYVDSIYQCKKNKNKGSCTMFGGKSRKSRNRKSRNRKSRNRKSRRNRRKSRR